MAEAGVLQKLKKKHDVKVCFKQARSESAKEKKSTINCDLIIEDLAMGKNVTQLKDFPMKFGCRSYKRYRHAYTTF